MSNSFSSKIFKVILFDKMFDKTKIDGHKHLFGGRILAEKHHFAHMCSYCDKAREQGSKHLIRFIPSRKAWNSWWVWGIYSGTYRYYFRYHSIFYRKQP